MAREPAWYTVIIDVVGACGWKHLEPPTTLPSEQEPQELAAYTAMSYNLADQPGPWQVRVYEGYNRFDNLLAVCRDGDT